MQVTYSEEPSYSLVRALHCLYTQSRNLRESVKIVSELALELPLFFSSECDEITAEFERILLCNIGLVQILHINVC